MGCYLGYDMESNPIVSYPWDRYDFHHGIKTIRWKKRINSTEMLKSKSPLFFYMLDFKKILVILFLSFLFLPFVNTAIAFNYNEISLPNIVTAENPYNQNLQHSSGKYIYAYINTDNFKLYSYIYSSTGSLLSDKAIILTGLVVTHSVSSYLKVVELNSTHFIIGIVAHRFAFAGDRHSYFVAIMVNINTYDYSLQTTLHIRDVVIGGSPPYAFASPISYVKYNSKFYFFFKLSDGGSTINYLYCIEYHPITRVLTNRMSYNLGSGYTATSQESLIQIYQNVTQDLDDIYLTTSNNLDITANIYYRCSLDTFTIETLSTHPTTTYYSNDSRLTQISNGIVYNGGNAYLYFIYSLPRYSVTHTTRIVYTIMKFNGTVINSSKFLSINSRVILITYNLESGTNLYWNVAFQTDFTELTVYYPYYDYTTTQFVNWELKIGLDNFFDMDDTEVSIRSDSQYSIYSSLNMIPYSEHDNIICRLPLTTFQSLQIDNPSNKALIYYGLTTLTNEFSLTVSHTPNDVPLETGTTYQFTFTTYLNNYPTKTTLLVYIDNNIVSSSSTDNNGFAWMNVIFSSAKVRTFLYKIYYNNVLVYEDTENYVVVSGTVSEFPTSEEMLPSTINQILYAIVPFVIVLTPTIVLGQGLGGIGYVTGLILGLTVSVLSGTLPMWSIYLLAFALIILFLYMIKGIIPNNSSGNGYTMESFGGNQ